MEKQLSIAEKTRFLASEKDWEVFFNTFMNPLGPNKKLRDAAKRYKEFVKENK